MKAIFAPLDKTLTLKMGKFPRDSLSPRQNTCCKLCLRRHLGDQCAVRPDTSGASEAGQFAADALG